MGFEDFTPPYLAPTTSGSVVLKGVNYASGGGGILNHTGKIFVRLVLSSILDKLFASFFFFQVIILSFNGVFTRFFCVIYREVE